MIRCGGALLLLCLIGCSPFIRTAAESRPEHFIVIEGVPFVAQQYDDDCGAAALAVLFAHRGQTVPVDEIREAVYDPRLEGALLADLENFARNRGELTRSGNGTILFLQQSVDAGRPVLIPVETGFWVVRRPHYLVIFGYDRDRFIAQAGSAGTVLIGKTDLDHRWASYRRLFLYLE